MKCTCCDKNLSDYESTLRHAETGEFLDTCLKCLKGLGIPTKGRDDLSRKEPIEEEKEDFSSFGLFFQSLGDEE